MTAGGRSSPEDACRNVEPPGHAPVSKHAFSCVLLVGVVVIEFALGVVPPSRNVAACRQYGDGFDG
jgi:hypothetical protein